MACGVFIATEKQSFAYNEFSISGHHCPSLPFRIQKLISQHSLHYLQIVKALDKNYWSILYLETHISV
jgi:hypothetical protein